MEALSKQDCQFLKFVHDICIFYKISDDYGVLYHTRLWFLGIEYFIGHCLCRVGRSFLGVHSKSVAHRSL